MLTIAEYLLLKSTNQNLYKLIRRLTVTVVLLLICSQLLLAYIGAVYTIPEKTRDKYNNYIAHFRVGLETHDLKSGLFKETPKKKLSFSVTDVKEAYSSYVGFKNGVFDVVVTDYLTARLLEKYYDGVPIAYECRENTVEEPIMERYALVSISIEGPAWRKWISMQADLKKRMKIWRGMQQAKIDLKKKLTGSVEAHRDLEKKLEIPLVKILDISRSLYLEYSDKDDKALLDKFLFSQSMFIHEYQQDGGYYLVVKSEYGEKTIFFKGPDNALELSDMIDDGFRGTTFFSETKGNRLTLTGRPTSVGRLISEIYLKNKTLGIEKWFSSVKYQNSGIDALKMLGDNKTDVVSVRVNDYKQYMTENPQLTKRLKIIWYSNPFVKSVVVVRKDVFKKYSKEISGLFVKDVLKKGERAGESLLNWKLFKDSTKSFDSWEFRINGDFFSYSKVQLLNGRPE
jgi:hypothetical protein